MLAFSKAYCGLVRPALCSSLFSTPRISVAANFSIVSNASAGNKAMPREADILIIGGGLIGQSIAYFLKHEQKTSASITLVERDPTYKIASSALSAASMRQQFSLPENIRLSIFTAQFVQKSQDRLDVEGSDEPVDLNYNFVPYLFLAETDKQAEILQRNVKIERENGAAVTLISPIEIKQRYPWLNVDKVKVGSLGLDNEGYFDPWSLMTALRRRNLASGVRYVHGEVEGFEMSKTLDGKLETNAAIVRDLSSPYAKKMVPLPIKFSKAIISSGCWSGQVASKLGLGRADGPVECRTPLPVEPRKRYMYVVHCPKGPTNDCPMVCDPNDIHFRREGSGGHILVGGRPLHDEPDISDLTSDDERFINTMWPILAARAPCFEECKLTHSWAGYYDYNPIDHNLIIGPHNYFKNVFFSTGLSGHGVMHSAGVGRAMSELIHYGKYKTIDLTRFGFDRIVANKPLKEQTML